MMLEHPTSPPLRSEARAWYFIAACRAIPGLLEGLKERAWPLVWEERAGLSAPIYYLHGYDEMDAALQMWAQDAGLKGCAGWLPAAGRAVVSNWAMIYRQDDDEIFSWVNIGTLRDELDREFAADRLLHPGPQFTFMLSKFLEPLDRHGFALEMPWTRDYEPDKETRESARDRILSNFASALDGHLRATEEAYINAGYSKKHSFRNRMSGPLHRIQWTYWRFQDGRSPEQIAERITDLKGPERAPTPQAISKATTEWRDIIGLEL